MKLHTNSIATNSVRETTENGRTYLVAEDVTLGRPQYLDGGYVDEQSWRESADKWDGQPAPIGHPTDADGNIISANLDAVQQHAVIGDIRDAYYSEADDGLNGDIWVEVGKAEQLGGLAADVPELLRNGNPLEVSTAYYSDPAPPGEYDGEYHENVRTNLRPDHVALLPGPLGPGRCSREDGCGIPPSEGVTDGSVTMEDTSSSEAVAANGVMFANAAGDGRGLVVSELAANSSGVEESGTLSAGMQSNARSEARNPSYDGTESKSWGDVSKTFSNFYGGYPDSDSDVDSWSDASQDARSWIASKSMLGEADADSFDEGLVHPVVNPSTNNLNEGALDAILGSRGETDKASDGAIESSRSKARSLLESKFDRDLDSNSTDMNTNQSEGDRVRWQSSNGNWRYGIVVDEAESSQQVADDEVLIAVYIQEEDGWTRSDQTVTVEEDDLNVIDEFPSEARSDNSAGDVPFGPSDLPEANSQSESFWQNMFSAAASFVSGSPEANSAATTESETESEADGPSVAETDAGSGCECGGACSECSGEHDGTTHTQPGDEAATSDEPEPDAANESEIENESGGSDSESDTTTNTTSMSFDDSDYERLAENSGWSEDELRSNDTVAEKVAETIDAQDDVNTNDEGGPEKDAEEDVASAVEDGVKAAQEQRDTSDDSSDEEMPVWAQELENKVEKIAANQEEDRQERRDQQKEEILANSETLTENMLEDMSDESLEEAYERVVPQTNGAPSGTDFGALNQPSAHINTDPAANSEDDEDIGPATSGSFDDFMAANAEDD